MNNKIRLCSVLLAAVMLLGCFSVPVVGGQEEQVEASYCNSFLAVVRSTEEHCFTIKDFAEIEALHHVMALEKSTTSSGVVYTLALILKTSDEAIVLQAMEGIKENPAVQKTMRNYYADDWADNVCSFQLDHDTVRIPVGGKAQLMIVHENWAYNQLAPVGIDFTVDPSIIDDSALTADSFSEYGFYTFYGNSERTEKYRVEPGYLVYSCDPALKEKSSEIHNYCGFLGDGKQRCRQVLQEMIHTPGILSAQLVYDDCYLPADMPMYHWGSNDASGVAVQDIDFGGDRIKNMIGLKPGSYTVVVNLSGGGVGKAKAQCRVEVYMPEQEDFSQDFHYDNSLVATVFSETQQQFSLSDFPELPECAGISVMKKQKTENGFKYELVLTLKNTGDAAVSAAMESIKKNEAVTDTQRNFYADDYGEKASWIQLNHPEAFVPVGGSTQLYIEDLFLVSKGGISLEGVEFTLDPTIWKDPPAESLAQLGIDDFWASPTEGIRYDNQGRCYYNEIFFWNGNKEEGNGTAENHTYFGISDTRSNTEQAWAKTITALSCMPGVLSVQLVYQQVPTGMPPHEIWLSDNEDVAAVTMVNGVPAEQFDWERGEQNCKVTITGKQPGTAYVTVTRGGFDVSRETRCKITVYMPEQEDFSQDFHYDNSLVATVFSETQQQFSLSDFPELPECAGISVMKKQKTENGFKYELVLTLKNTGDAAVSAAMESIKKNEAVTDTQRNFYADDYGEKASWIQLNHPEAFVPVGGNTQLYIEDLFLVSKGGISLEGVEFTLDPTIWKEPPTDFLAQLGIDDFWASPTEGIRYDNQGRCYYKGPFFWGGNKEGNETAENHTYFGISNARLISEWEWAKIITTLSCIPGISSVQLVYQQVPTGMPPHEIWSSDHEEIAAITMVNGIPAEQFNWERGEQNCKVTITGKQPGTAYVTVTRGGFDVSRETRCKITVYQPGDVDENGVVNAVDALLVLQHAVGIQLLQENTVAFYSAQVNNDSVIDAVDALEILKQAVGVKPLA